MARLARATLAVVALVGVGGTLTGAASGARSAGQRAEATGPVTLVRSFETDDRFTAPAGLAYDGRSRALYLARASKAGQTEIERITLSGRRSATIRLAVSLRDVANVTFDERRRRLLLVTSDSIVEVRGTGSGLAPRSLSKTALSLLPVSKPRGITVDEKGTVYVFDARGPALVRIVPKGGRLANAAITRIALPSAGLATARGVAYDPTSGNLQLGTGKRLVELTPAGVIVASRNLAPLALGPPNAFTFGATGDQTDDPILASVYLATSVSARGPGAKRGRLVELSLRSLPRISVPAIPAPLVRTTDLARIAPPAPDPAGIELIASTNRLLVVDSEVEEVTGGTTSFAGANVWELNLDGSVVRSGSVATGGPVPVTNEPTDITWDPSRSVFYVSDDDRQRVSTVDPGPDATLATADDRVVSSFSTAAAGNLDPEGITVDPAAQRLYVVDGVNAEVYVYTTAGEPAGHFDVSSLVVDPEAVEFNATRGTLLVLGRGPFLAETSTSGALLRVFDVSALRSVHPAGLALAPSSDGRGTSFYIVDRGIDNDTRPGIVDGRLVELRAPASSAPLSRPPGVSAGGDLDVALPGSATLRGSATDDGLPQPPGSVRVSWSQVSGPGIVTFAAERARVTEADFTVAGTYVLRLTANDGEWTSVDEVVVNVTGSRGIASLDREISAPTDDAEETTTGNVTISSTDLDLMADTGSLPVKANARVGLRFQDIVIPPGARITNAYVQFQTDEELAAPTQLQIAGQADANPAGFRSQAGDLSSRPVTSTSVAWSPQPWLDRGGRGLDQRTPNLAAVVQEIVARADWVPGNPLVLIVSGTPGSHRVARAFEAKAPRQPAELHVEWTASPGGRPPTLRITSPPDDRSFEKSARIRLQASATDPEDGNLGSSVTWRSSRDGALGSGAVVTVVNLSVGSHVIEAEVRDRDGQVVRSRVTLTILP